LLQGSAAPATASAVRIGCLQKTTVKAP